MKGLMLLYAFAEIPRIVWNDAAKLPQKLKRANGNNIERVRKPLSYLLHGPGDFPQQLNDVLYIPARELRYFGRFCAQKLFVSIRPIECPPMTNRMVKVLQCLGFDVRAN